MARLVGLFALGALGALQWQRLIGGMSSGRALLWVLVAVAAAIGVLACERIRSSRLQVVALPAVTLLALFVGYWLSGAGLDFLKPKHWDELLSGLGGGLQALGTVRLPYVSADPWPRIVLELLGAELLILAGLLTFWPRASEPPEARVPLTAPDRGYPFVAVAVLFVVVVSPVISLGGTTRSLLLGLALAALTVVFLWLERLPLRPGLGVAGLIAVALFGALPIAAAADRGEPWFDYRAFAESLGPDDPVRFSWTQGYGPITWPRDGNEVMRVVSKDPLYWKARNLDVFTNYAWTTRSEPVDPQGEEPYALDMPEDWKDTPAWTNDIEVSIRRMRIADVVGAGTTVDVKDASRAVEQGTSPGTWDAPIPLRRGDSYTASVHVPQPTQVQLADAASGEYQRVLDETTITVPYKLGEVHEVTRSAASIIAGTIAGPVTTFRVRFKPWDGVGSDRVDYPGTNRSSFDVDKQMKRSQYERTWALSKELKKGTERPMDYVRKVYDYLHQPEFRYVERPAQPPAGVAPLDYFLNQTHEGYCQHYAGAMALLLRMGGVPARVATGFSPGGYSARKKAWIVRDTDAHAWVEVWFDKYGWVTIDPTPDGTPARSQVAALAPEPGEAPPAAAADTGASDAAANTERPNISLRPELQLGTGDPAIPGATADQKGIGFGLILLAVVAVLVVVLAVLLFLRRPRGATPMDRAINEVENALERVGRPVSVGTTMTQLERRLGSHSPEVSAYLRALAAGRYALSPPPPPRAGRRALRRALAQGLGFGGGLRALWALPPRLERGARDPRSRTFEVETSVRVRS
ncbi:transglutaminase-like domain-containing protein [Solirubrobacter soli]|uniref:transglutaminase-like domain-containing protein n=1 Tax=Solirubrobacter soli TaxID=363832 RepID=UPI000480B934|nr:transglutaminase-like domain-containing protein [Solirubrobacter soli]